MYENEVVVNVIGIFCGFPLYVLYLYLPPGSDLIGHMEILYKSNKKKPE